jgi:beta-xylosidase
MTRRGDWYYLFYSTKGCCGPGCDYQLEVSRAKDLRGPWEASPLGPLLTGGGAWKCPGHGTMVSLADGRDYFLYHAYPAKGDVFLGRQGLLDELQWPDDGWPAFACGPSPSTSAPLPFPERTASEGPMDFVDDFEGPRPSVEWQWDIKHPPKTSISEGKLHLETAEGATGGPIGAFLGARVKRGDYSFTATINPGGSGTKGIAVYGDENNALGVKIEDNSVVIWKVEKAAIQSLATAKRPEGGTPRLRMTVREGHRFRFSFSSDGKSWNPIGDSEREIDGAFLPPWDRAPRVGVMVSGSSGDAGSFEAVELRYERK